jgi:hypothetical protein
LEARTKSLTKDLIAKEAQIKNYTKLRKKAMKNGINESISLGVSYELKA